MNLIRIPLRMALLGLVLAGCAAGADFDIRGEWSYTLTTADGNTYDAGSLTFSGEPGRGTYRELNFYAVEYTGEYTVRGNSVELLGAETWKGSLVDAYRMEGTWSHDDASGTFIAERK